MATYFGQAMKITNIVQLTTYWGNNTLRTTTHISSTAKWACISSSSLRAPSSHQRQQEEADGAMDALAASGTL